MSGGPVARSRKKGLIVGDRRTHAVRLSVTGPKALCGAGRINLTMPDTFDPDEWNACTECVAKARAKRS